MTDIVERLRSQDPNGLSILLSIQEAAAEIERLRAALHELKGHVNKQEPLGIIDRALEPKP